MTNEQMAELINEGGNEELLPLMWEKVRGLFRQFSCSYYTRHEARCRSSGVTVDDLHQESYFAMLEAVSAYGTRPEEQKELAFTSFCRFPFLSRAAALTGERTARTKHDPINTYRQSLDDKPYADDGDELPALGDIIPDESAEEAFREAEERVYIGDIHRVIEAALDKLPADPARAVRERYWNGRTQGEIAALLNRSPQWVHQLEHKALRELRKLSEIRELYGAVSIYSVSPQRQLAHGSAVEQEAERRERLRDRYERRLDELGGEEMTAPGLSALEPVT